MFQTLSNMPSEDDIKFCFPVAERFVVLMYDRSSGCETTEAPRLELFTHKSRSIDCIPPTSAALFQHVLCVRYIKQVTAGVRLLFHHLHYPLQLVWVDKEAAERSPWQPLWLTLLPASKSCQEFLKCGCDKEKGCRGRCKCVKVNLPCTTLCKCNGFCDRL